VRLNLGCAMASERDQHSEFVINHLNLLENFCGAPS